METVCAWENQLTRVCVGVLWAPCSKSGNDTVLTNQSAGLNGVRLLHVKVIQKVTGDRWGKAALPASKAQAAATGISFSSSRGASVLVAKHEGKSADNVNVCSFRTWRIISFTTAKAGLKDVQPRTLRLCRLFTSPSESEPQAEGSCSQPETPDFCECFSTVPISDRKSCTHGIYISASYFHCYIKEHQKLPNSSKHLLWRSLESSRIWVLNYLSFQE